MRRTATRWGWGYGFLAALPLLLPALGCSNQLPDRSEDQSYVEETAKSLGMSEEELQQLTGSEGEFDEQSYERIQQRFDPSQMMPQDYPGTGSGR